MWVDLRYGPAPSTMVENMLGVQGLTFNAE